MSRANAPSETLREEITSVTQMEINSERASELTKLRSETENEILSIMWREESPFKRWHMAHKWAEALASDMADELSGATSIKFPISEDVTQRSPYHRGRQYRFANVLAILRTVRHIRSSLTPLPSTLPLSLEELLSHDPLGVVGRYTPLFSLGTDSSGLGSTRRAHRVAEYQLNECGTWTFVGHRQSSRRQRRKVLEYLNADDSSVIEVLEGPPGANEL